MTNDVSIIELELEPIPPDTVSSLKAELMPLIEKTLSESGKGDLLSSSIQIQVEESFPVDAAIIVGLTFLSGVALETYKALLLPVLKRKCNVKVKNKPAKKK